MSQNRNEQASREFFSGTAPIEGLHEMKFGVSLGDTPLDPKILAQFLVKTAQRLMQRESRMQGASTKTRNRDQQGAYSED